MRRNVWILMTGKLFYLIILLLFNNYTEFTEVLEYNQESVSLNIFSSYYISIVNSSAFNDGI